MSLSARHLGKFLSVAFGIALFARCGNESSPLGPSGVGPPGSTGGGVLVGAGDIGVCGSPGPEATARLLDRIAGTVIALGDNAYFSGSAEEFNRCYEPTWGRHRSRTRPVPGNHEYESGGAPYFAYFGDLAGPRGLGYYSYTVGSWHVIALNSEVPSGRGSPQSEWLRRELSARRSICTAAYWHRPLYSSGRNGDNPDMRELWQTLYEFDADLVINAHDHSYERFAPQDADGRLDPTRGIRQFVVGTGGASLYEFSRIRPNSEVRGAVWGVAVFTLLGGGYQWEFVPVDGAPFTDSGSGSCH